MKNRYKHKGVKDLKILNNYEICFGAGSQAQRFRQEKTFSDSDLKTLIELTCAQCKNFKCERAGFVFGYRQRNEKQVEILLNNPQISEVSTEDHKRIASMGIENLKQKIEQLTLGTPYKEADWEKADRSESVKNPKKEFPEIDSKNFFPLEEIPKIEKVPSDTKISLKKPNNSSPMRNTPISSEGIILEGGKAPPSPIVRPIDPWADADKMVKSGATITVTPEKKIKKS